MPYIHVEEEDEFEKKDKWREILKAIFLIKTRRARREYPEDYA